MLYICFLFYVLYTHHVIIFRINIKPIHRKDTFSSASKSEKNNQFFCVLPVVHNYIKLAFVVELMNILVIILLKKRGLKPPN